MSNYAQWGAFQWGELEWGAGVGDPQGTGKAKADTRLLIDVATSATADTSQRAADLTSSGSHGYEAPSARMELDPEMTVALVFDWATGTLFYVGDTSVTNYHMRIRIDGASGSLKIDNSVDSSDVFDLAKPSWVSSGEKVLLHLAYYSDPANASAYRYELALHNMTSAQNDDWHIEQAGGQSDSITSAAYNMSYGGQWDGASLADAFGDTIYWLRVSARAHAVQESVEDFIALTPAPTIESRVGGQRISVPGDLSGEGEFAGPVYQWSQYAHGGHYLRLLSPLLEAACREPPTCEDDLSDVYPAQWILNMEDGEYQANLAWVWRVAIPSNCSFARVRVHAKLWESLGGTPDKLECRVHCSNDHLGTQSLAPNYYVTGSRTTDDTSTGTGGWVECTTGSGKPLRLTRDDKGFAYLSLTTSVNDGVASANTRYEINHISIQPLSRLTDEGNGWGGGMQGWAP